MKIYNRRILRDQRRCLRNNPTKEEKTLWFELRNRHVGFKFRRQHGIGPYIVDFYCPERKLVIEIDGKIHTKQIAYDKIRDKYLEDCGCTILHFSNQEIQQSVIEVRNRIVAFLYNTTPAPLLN